MDRVVDDAPVIEDRIVKGYSPGQPIPDVDYAAYLRTLWGQFKDRTALIKADTGERYTYHELEDACSRVAGGLASLGFQPGDMAGIHCDTSLEAMVAFYGTAFAGGSMVFAKGSLTAREVNYQFKDTKPCIVFCDEENAAKAAEACKTIPSVKTLVIFGQNEGMMPFSTLRQSCPPAALPSVDPDSLLAILYSSGTTGLPKGTLLSNRNAVASLFSSRNDRTKAVEQDDVLLGSAPFTHVSGLLFNNAIFAHGACLVIIASLEPSDMLPAIEKYKGTIMFQFPTFLKKLVRSPLLEKYDISSVKKIYAGGSATPSVIVEETLRKFNLEHFGQAYSMSESFGSGMISRRDCKDYESVGTATTLTEIKIVDVNTGAKLGPRQTGEIRIRSQSCVRGYLNNPEATASLYDEDGFLRSGDIGYYNERGEFYVVDRIKEMFKCMDQQVAPSEIEDMLLQHEAVKDAAVAGVPHPEFGDAPRAFVVLRKGYAASEGTAAELRALVSAKVARHKHLHGGVEFVSSIPKSDTGKSLRRDLRDAYLQRQAVRGL
ncbi:luciferin 4-monooxygenase-like [Amblyomma americanum]